MRFGGRALAGLLALLLLWTALPLCASAAEPTKLYIAPGTDQTMRIQETLQMQATVLPADAPQAVVWSSSNKKTATVTQKGIVTAKKPGLAVITATSAANAAVRAAMTVTVKSAPKPKKIAITPDTRVANLGAQLRLTAVVSPANASQTVRWSSGNRKIATVSEDGVVTPLKEGKVKITARSKVRSSVRTVRTIRVVDPSKPTSIAIADGSVYLAEAETHALDVEILPTTADKGVTWRSSNDAVVTVDDAGKLEARRYGRATVTATTANGKLKDSVAVVVLNAERATEIPLRTTSRSAAQIDQNFAKIDAIRLSAYNELERLVKVGAITEKQMARRKNALIGAFSMYRFAWITTTRVAYWTSAYAGAKDFRPGRVYYGLPYIQCGLSGNYNNRRYNVSKAVGNRYFTKSGRYYKMTGKRLSGRYVGNDCSSFVSMATWGMKSAFSYLNTVAMATSSAYRTVSGFDSLRPGDALVKSGSHTVMFLYYTNPEKSRMMIIEQGGGTSSDMHNTVTCSVVARSGYSGYRIRRARDF